MWQPKPMGVKSMVYRELWDKAALAGRMHKPKKRQKKRNIATNNAIEEKALGRVHCGLQVCGGSL